MSTFALLAGLVSASLAVQTVGGAPARVPVRPHGTVVVFWRADCGPCLLELRDLAALRRAASPMSVTPVALQPTRDLDAALRRTGLAAAETLVAPGDGGGVLTLFGGAPPRLPLAVAFDERGRACSRRTGLLGYDHLRAWARACGGARARGR